MDRRSDESLFYIDDSPSTFLLHQASKFSINTFGDDDPGEGESVADDRGHGMNIKKNIDSCETEGESEETEFSGDSLSLTDETFGSGKESTVRNLEISDKILDSKDVCMRETEACHDAVFSAQYEKGFNKEEAFQRLVARAFLIPIQRAGERSNKMLEAVVPPEKLLIHKLKELVGSSRVQRMQQIRSAQEKLRDYYGATVSVETMKKLENIKEKHRLEKLKQQGAQPLPIERDNNMKQGRYMTPRVPIKHSRRGKREKIEIDPIQEPDFNRLKNALWRMETESYEMVYPVTCEIRRKKKFLKAAEEGHLGPGSYYVDEYYDIQKRKKLEQGKGYLNKQSKRFPENEEVYPVPSATAYGNPYENLEKKNRMKNGATRTIFETATPFKKDTTYCVPDTCCYSTGKSSIDRLLQSRKGVLYPDKMEDKVKLHRNKDSRGLIKFGYQRTVEKNIPESKFTPKGFVDIITNPRRRLLGIFSTVDRNAYDGGIQSVRQPRLEHAKDRPGPGSYSIPSFFKPVTKSTKEGVKEDDKLCCTMQTKYEEPANPAYYNERKGFKYLYKNIKGHGARSAFRSTGFHDVKEERVVFLGERLKGINIPPNEAKENELNVDTDTECCYSPKC